MTEWWKTIAEKVGSVARPAPKEGLRGRLESERDRLRIEEEQRRKKGITSDPRYQGTLGEQIRDEDLRALGTLLAWKLDVTLKPSQNPDKVDGLWFGVEREALPPRTDLRAGETQETFTWKLYLHRPCPHCKHLLRTLPLGDYSEALASVQAVSEGLSIPVAKSTDRLAAYLHDIEMGRADPYCPRSCPSCHKPIKGGTL